MSDAVRLTVTFARRKGRPHQPQMMEKGGRITEVHPSWSAAAVRLAELAEGRKIQHASVTDLLIADRNYERGGAPRR